MMQLANGNWALLAGNEPIESEEQQCDGLGNKRPYGAYEYRLAGVVSGGRIIERWCAIVR